MFFCLFVCLLLLAELGVPDSCFLHYMAVCGCRCHGYIECVCLSLHRAVIREDMEDWTKASIWPLSCYTFTKERPCLPGFREVSPEELRWEAYQANAAGNSERYLQGIQTLGEEQMSVRHRYMSITATDVSEMVRFYPLEDNCHIIICDIR